MALKYSNNATTTLSASVSSGTTLTVVSTSTFPALASGEWTYVTIGGDVLKVTAKTSTTFTTAIAITGSYTSGDNVELRISKELLDDLSTHNHDDLTGFVANEHIDWTTDQGATNVHAGNYTDTDTTYSVGDGGLTQINFTSADNTKLDGIEAGAKGDQTGAEIKTAYEAESNTNAYTDTEKTKLSGVATSANNYSLPVASTTVSGGIKVGTNLSIASGVLSSTDTDTTYSVGDGGLTQKNFTTTLKTKLDGIDTSADVNRTMDATPTNGNTSNSVSSDGVFDALAGKEGADSTILKEAEIVDTLTSTSTTAPLSAKQGKELKTLVDSKSASTHNHSGVYANASHSHGVADLPAIALTTVQTTSTQVLMLALTAQEGDVVIRSDENKTYIHNGGTAGTMDDFTVLATPTDAVTSVDGNTGVVTLNHDTLTGFVTDEHLDWTGDQGAKNIHANNYTNTTYSEGDGGLTQKNFTTTLKTKLDGISTSANNYSLPTSSASVLGGVKVGTNLSIASGVLSSTDTNTTYSVGDGGLTQKNFTTTLKTKLDGIATSANNFSLPTASSAVLGGIKVGTNLTIASGVLSSTDTNTTYSVGDGGLTEKNFTTALNTKLSGIETSATADQTNAEIKTAYEANANSNEFSDAEQTKLSGVATSANNYTHPTTAGYKHVPTGGASGQFLKYSASGTAVWASDNDTTYSVGDGGLTQKNFTTADNTKLDGIATSANNYSHPTGAGDKHIPTAGASGQFLKYSASGTAVWANDNNTVYTLPTASSSTLGGIKVGTNLSIASGVLSSTDTNTTYSVGDGGLTQINFTSADNTKLDGISTSANNYSLPTASTTVLGGVKVGTNLSIASGVLSSTDTNTTYSVGDGGLTQKNFTTTLKTKLDGIATSANNYSLPSSVVHDTEKGSLHATDALRLSGHTVSLYKGDGTSESVTIPDNNTTYSVGDNGLTAKNFTSTLKTKLDGIATSANNYSHPTTAGDKHIPTGGSVGQLLINTASGTGTWQNAPASGMGYAESTTAPTSPTPANGDLWLDTGDEILYQYQSGVWVQISDDGTAQGDGNLTTKGDLEVFGTTQERLGVGTNGQVLKADSTATHGVAWATDTNTTYSAGTGLDLSGTTFSIEPDLRDVTHVGNAGGEYIHYDDSNGWMRFYLNSAEDFRMLSNGDFHADGDVIAYSTTVSDERLKENIQPIEDALSKVNQLNGCTFTYTADGKESAGLIAQDVEKVLPSAVSEKELPLKIDDGEKYKVLQYDQTIGLLVEAIKELSAKVEELEGK